MLSGWHTDFFRNLENNPVNSQEYQQFKPLFDLVFEELSKVMNELFNSDNEADKLRYQEYETVLTDWHGYKQRISRRKDSHFGYPMHLSKRNFMVDFFRIMESFEVIQNNFGDIHDISDIEIADNPENPKLSGNNYAMDTKSLEWDIVRLMAENLGLPEQPRLVDIRRNPSQYENGYWGYVSSGGSESNLWGINQGFAKYPDGILYFCEGAHYSIPKAAGTRNCQVVSQISPDDEAIDVAKLIDAISVNWYSRRKAAIIVLTFGTTKFGSVDDVAAIKMQLSALKIPHYIHIDAALNGGIPKNQHNAPKFGKLDEWGYDSVSVSLHKYIGYPAAKGVLISTKKPIGTFIDYIGQEDNTVLGSRDVPAFSLRQQVIEVLQYSDPYDYIRNIDAFEQMLDKLDVKFHRWSDGVCKGNTFVFKVNRGATGYREICKRWQCSEFLGKDNQNRIHVIIYHTHATDKLKMLANDLAVITAI